MDLEAKKKLLRRVPSGLYVISSFEGGKHHAFTGSFLSQMSLKPPGIVIAVRRDSQSFEMISKSKAFAVNYIRKDNKATLEHFFKAATALGEGPSGFSLLASFTTRSSPSSRLTSAIGLPGE